MRKQGLAAFNIKDAKIVILGTFPGEESLRMGKYYSDSRNQFWQLLGLEKHDFDGLKKLNMGLWDVIESCERDNSADNNIKNEQYNKLSVLNKKMILFNGVKAYEYFLNAQEKQKTTVNVYKKQILPSSSGALSIELKVKRKQWKRIINKYKTKFFLKKLLRLS